MCTRFRWSLGFDKKRRYDWGYDWGQSLILCENKKYTWCINCLLELVPGCFYWCLQPQNFNALCANSCQAKTLINFDHKTRLEFHPILSRFHRMATSRGHVGSLNILRRPGSVRPASLLAPSIFFRIFFTSIRANRSSRVGLQSSRIFI